MHTHNLNDINIGKTLVSKMDIVQTHRPVLKGERVT